MKDPGGNLKFKVADNDVLRFCPMVEYVIGEGVEEVPADEEVPPAEKPPAEEVPPAEEETPTHASKLSLL
ncbi:MAG: hypothetical protein GIS02_02380 [Methanosarcinales archaeon]|uniref:Uncharacterized protein n=1 Tax=Candidatus Ethanoperedens thermophilum TaxID=2766897 RepID=A0A848DAY1_9EURY|nr:hypothetical protein [Candidatus Ethanoperedens thermophilum]